MYSITMFQGQGHTKTNILLDDLGFSLSFDLPIFHPFLKVDIKLTIIIFFL